MSDISSQYSFNIMFRRQSYYELLFIANRIAERRDVLTNRRQKVKACSLDRSKQLQASLQWHKFCSDADEVIEMLYNYSSQSDYWLLMQCII